jgi:hypothetical protein
MGSHVGDAYKILSQRIDMEISVKQDLAVDLVIIENGVLKHIRCGELENGIPKETMKALPAPDPDRMKILEQRRKWRAQKRASYQKRRGLENTKRRTDSA